MADEKILKNSEENPKADEETLSDEQLDGVAGGSGDNEDFERWREKIRRGDSGFTVR